MSSKLPQRCIKMIQSSFEGRKRRPLTPRGPPRTHLGTQLGIHWVPLDRQNESTEPVLRQHGVPERVQEWQKCIKWKSAKILKHFNLIASRIPPGRVKWTCGYLTSTNRTIGGGNALMFVCKMCTTMSTPICSFETTIESIFSQIGATDAPK